MSGEEEESMPTWSIHLEGKRRGEGAMHFFWKRGRTAAPIERGGGPQVKSEAQKRKGKWRLHNLRLRPGARRKEGRRKKQFLSKKAVKGKREGGSLSFFGLGERKKRKKKVSNLLGGNNSSGEQERKRWHDSKACTIGESKRRREAEIFILGKRGR